MRIAKATPAAVDQVSGRIEATLGEPGSLEAAAQGLARELHLSFDESVALARVFFTVPYGELPV